MRAGVAQGIAGGRQLSDIMAEQLQRGQHTGVFAFFTQEQQVRHVLEPPAGWFDEKISFTCHSIKNTERHKRELPHARVANDPGWTV